MANLVPRIRREATAVGPNARWDAYKGVAGMIWWLLGGPAALTWLLSRVTELTLTTILVYVYVGLSIAFVAYKVLQRNFPSIAVSRIWGLLGVATKDPSHVIQHKIDKLGGFIAEHREIWPRTYMPVTHEHAGRDRQHREDVIRFLTHWFPQSYVDTYKEHGVEALELFQKELLTGEEMDLSLLVKPQIEGNADVLPKELPAPDEPALLIDIDEVFFVYERLWDITPECVYLAFGLTVTNTEVRATTVKRCHLVIEGVDGLVEANADADAYIKVPVFRREPKLKIIDAGADENGETVVLQQGIPKRCAWSFKVPLKSETLADVISNNEYKGKPYTLIVTDSYDRSYRKEGMTDANPDTEYLTVKE